MGDPDAASDKSRIVQAAKLGGAREFIEDLPDGYDTVLENRLNLAVRGRNGELLYSQLAELGVFKASSRNATGLSGGQMQRCVFVSDFD